MQSNMVAIMRCIPEVFSSNLGQSTGCDDRSFFMGRPSPSRQKQG
jgi:hypothetical protein